MPIRERYYGEHDEDIVDVSKPLLVTSVGNYRILSQKERKTNRPEGRNDYQLIYVASGKAHFYFNGTKKIVTKGSAVIIHPKEPQLYFLYAADKPDVFWTHFTGRDVKNIFKRYGIPLDENVFFVGSAPEYTHFFNQMISELHLRYDNFEDMLVTYLKQILIVMSRFIKENRCTDSNMINEIEKSVLYFNDFYNADITIEKYASERNMTPYWFIQNFKKITSSTPMQYIISLRISHAIDLLETSNLNVNQIAEKVGYNNSLYFSRLFKKYTGISPMEYRKRKTNEDI